VHHLVILEKASQCPVHVAARPERVQGAGPEPRSSPVFWPWTIDVTPLTAPGVEGYDLPGADVTFRLTLRDGCLSCHTSYPPGHVERFGPIVSSYVGGKTESWNQCTTACHTTHPGSGL